MTDSKSNDENILRVNMEENVSILENGLANLSLLLDVPPSPMADLYRESLGAPANASVEEIMPIPDNKSMMNGTSLIPVRDEFYRSIEQQQLESLGFEVNVLDSLMMPKDRMDALKVWLRADVLLPIRDVANIGSDDRLTITIGSLDLKAAAGSMFTTIQMVQMMLQSIPEESAYEYYWTTTIDLPRNTALLNRDEISELHWMIDFGGGTYRTAMLSVQGNSTITLREIIVVTKKEITASPDYLYCAASRYKIFNVEFLLPHSLSYSSSQNPSCVDDWSADCEKSWIWPITPIDFEETVPLPGGGTLSASASLTINFGLDLQCHVAWDFDWFQGLTLFEAWMQFSPSVSVIFDASVSAMYSKIWTYDKLPGLDYSFTVWFWVFPIEMTLRFQAIPYISFDAFGKVEVYAGAGAGCAFTVGIRWTRSRGYEPINDLEFFLPEIIGPSVEAEASISARAGIRFRFSLLFYNIAGPFVEFEPYVAAAASCNWQPPSPPEGQWEVTCGFRVVAGVTFESHIRSILGLSDWAVALFDRPIRYWNGTWDYSGGENDMTPPGTTGIPVSDGLHSSSGNVTWAWNPALEDEGRVLQYHVQVGSSPGMNDTFDGYVGLSLNKTLFNLPGGNTTYYARVRAQNEAGLWGDWSGVSDGVTVDTPPATAILSGTYEISDGSASFNWTATDDVTSQLGLVYSYTLQGYDSAWSPLTNATTISYENLPAGNYTFKVRAVDSSNNTDPTPAERSFLVCMIMNLHPGVLNLHPGPNVKNKGEWIGARAIEAQDLGSVNVSTIMLNGTVGFAGVDFAPLAVGDYDGNGIPDLIVCFNRTVVSNYILSKGITVGNVTLTVTGKLDDETLFEDSMVVGVRMPGDSNGDGIVDIFDTINTSLTFGCNLENSRWNSAADENEDGTIDIFDIIIVCSSFGKAYT